MPGDPKRSFVVDGNSVNVVRKADFDWRLLNNVSVTLRIKQLIVAQIWVHLLEICYCNTKTVYKKVVKWKKKKAEKQFYLHFRKQFVVSKPKNHINQAVSWIFQSFESIHFNQKGRIFLDVKKQKNSKLKKKKEY